MKLVYSNGIETSSKVISEKEYYDYWHNPEWTKLETKTSYEACRLEKYNSLNNHELIIIYKDNRQLRTRNTWKEYRILRAFSKWLLEQKNYSLEEGLLYHGVQYHVESDSGIYHTEIDGLLKTDPKTGIEIKSSKITKSKLDFFIKKINLLELDHLNIFAPGFSNETLFHKPSDITLWTYTLDSLTLEKYYKAFTLPDFIKQEIGKRHLRFLMQNGRWISPKRRVTATAKHSSNEKIIQEIFKLKTIPVKFYYSLARVIDPIGEFRGKGHPINQIILGFDIDADPHQHVISEASSCKICLRSSLQKLQKVLSILNEENITYKVLLSGAKGFHVYLVDKTDKVMIGKESDVNNYLNLFGGLVDDFRSTYTKDWDYHRIFKLPGTLDASTGQKIRAVDINDNCSETELEQIIKRSSIEFKDIINKLA